MPAMREAIGLVVGCFVARIYGVSLGAADIAQIVTAGALLSFGVPGSRPVKYLNPCRPGILTALFEVGRRGWHDAARVRGS